MALPPIEDGYPRARSKVTKNFVLGPLLGVIENVRQPHNTFTFGQLDGLNTHTAYVTLSQDTTIPTTPFTLDLFAPCVVAIHQTRREWKLDGPIPGEKNVRLVEARLRIVKHLKTMENIYPTSNSWSYVTNYVFTHADVFLVRVPNPGPGTIVEAGVWPAGRNWKYYGYLPTHNALLYFNQQLKSGTLCMRRIHPTTNKHFVEFTPGQLGQTWVP